MSLVTGDRAASASASSSSSSAAGRGEEARRRQLVGVAGDDDPVGPHDRADRVGRGDLGGLVEDDDVEAPLRREAAGRPRAGSSPSTASPRRARWGGLEQLTDREVLALEPGLVLDDVGLVG